MEVQVTETRKTVLGLEHPDTLTSVNDLALAYSAQGRWVEAEKLLVQVVETSKTVLGPEHLDTLKSISNLAHAHSKQAGRWAEAEKLMVQVMETRNTVLGPEHPDTLTSMSNLACTYLHQGRWVEAEKLGVQVMEVFKTVFGPNHPNTLTVTTNLSFIYYHQGRYNIGGGRLVKTRPKTASSVAVSGHAFTRTDFYGIIMLLFASDNRICLCITSKIIFCGGRGRTVNERQVSFHFFSWHFSQTVSSDTKGTRVFLLEQTHP
jgi:Tetratricopeptide repeat